MKKELVNNSGFCYTLGMEKQLVKRSEKEVDQVLETLEKTLGDVVWDLVAWGFLKEKLADGEDVQESVDDAQQIL